MGVLKLAWAPVLMAGAVLCGILTPSPALAWNEEGHRIVALIADHYLEPAAKQKVDAILGADTDPLTQHDIASEAVWADVAAGKDKAAAPAVTSSWHSTPMELTHPDIDTACAGHAMLAKGTPASAGPAACSLDKVDQFIAELSAAVQAEPQSVDKSRKVAELFEQKGDLENSLEWYRYVLGLSGGADPTIARKISDLQLRQIDAAFTAREEYLAASPDDPEAPRYREEMEELRKQRAAFVLAEARERVDRNPTDLLAHFDLGVALMDAGEPQDAIGHFQRARSNPSVRLKAMGKLGQCYVARSMNDLAAKTFSDAVTELVGMDSVKKDLLYNLGTVYESMEKKSEALDCFKQIYEVDYGYRDVAQKVESSYGQS